MEYCSRTECVYCKGTLRNLEGQDRCQTACVWTGAVWEKIQHGMKECQNSRCKTRYRLSYVASVGEKANHLSTKDITDDTIILVHPGLGFRWRYLRQLWHRTCRSAVSGGAEASVILLTDPTFEPTFEKKGKSSKGKGQTRVCHLGLDINRALTCYLLIEFDNEVDFDVADPVPKKHCVYGKPNEGFHQIFCKDQSTPSQVSKPIDVVADGTLLPDGALDLVRRNIKWTRKRLAAKRRNNRQLGVRL